MRVGDDVGRVVDFGHPFAPDVIAANHLCVKWERVTWFLLMGGVIVSSQEAA